MSLGLLDSCWNFLGIVFDGLMVCDMILQLFRPDSQQHRFEYGIMNAEVGSGKELVHKLDASCMICIICIVCLFDNKTNMQTCKLIKVGCLSYLFASRIYNPTEPGLSLFPCRNAAKR